MNSKEPTLQQQSTNPQQHINPQIKINLDELERVKCEGCDGEHFDLVWRIHKVPAMLSQTGKEALFPVAYFRCVDCLKLTNIVNRR